jgi:predicted nuclease of predicted toxin-antitoxin system
MKLLVDMNLSPVWVEFLVGAGFKAVHWSEIGEASAADHEIMEWAAKHDHVVLTADLDFGAILAATRAARPSVLLVRSHSLKPSIIGGAVVAAMGQTRQELLDGALVSVDPVRARLRILPLLE